MDLVEPSAVMPEVTGSEFRVHVMARVADEALWVQVRVKAPKASILSLEEARLAIPGGR